MNDIYKKLYSNDDTEKMSYGKGKPDDITVLSMWVQSDNNQLISK